MLGRISNEDGLVRLHFSERLDSAGTASLRECVSAVAEHGTGDAVLDFSAVSYIDGTAIAVIAFLFKRLTGEGRRLTVSGAVGQPAAMLQQLGLAGLLGVEAGQVARPARRRSASMQGWVHPLARRLAGW